LDAIVINKSTAVSKNAFYKVENPTFMVSWSKDDTGNNKINEPFGAEGAYFIYSYSPGSKGLVYELSDSEEYAICVGVDETFEGTEVEIATNVKIDPNIDKMVPVLTIGENAF
jgi:hypothetical protein